MPTGASRRASVVPTRGMAIPTRLRRFPLRSIGSDERVGSTNVRLAKDPSAPGRVASLLLPLLQVTHGWAGKVLVSWC